MDTSVRTRTDADWKPSGPVGATAGDLLRSAELAIARLEESLNREAMLEGTFRPFNWPEFADSETNPSLGGTPSHRSPDSEVAIQIEIGSTIISLEQLRDLPLGSFIALDNSLEDPVVIYADEMPIALGELMIWNECYGVRIIKLLDGVASFQVWT